MQENLNQNIDDGIRLLNFNDYTMTFPTSFRS